MFQLAYEKSEAKKKIFQQHSIYQFEYFCQRERALHDRKVDAQ